MRPARSAATVCLALLVAIASSNVARADDPEDEDLVLLVDAGAIVAVDRVVLEPSDERPESIRIYGVWTLRDSDSGTYLAASQGFMSFRCPKGRESECKAQWAVLVDAQRAFHCVGIGADGPPGRLWKNETAVPLPQRYPLGNGTRTIEHANPMCGEAMRKRKELEPPRPPPPLPKKVVVWRPPVVPEKPRHQLAWLVREGLGFGYVMPSPHERLIELEGDYGRSFFLCTADFLYFPGPRALETGGIRWGLGFYSALEYRGGRVGKSSLSETDVYGGFQFGLKLVHDSVMFIATARGGYGLGFLSFEGDAGVPMNGFGGGLELSVHSTGRFPIGAALGFLGVKARDTVGGLGDDYILGGPYFLLSLWQGKPRG